MTMLRNICAALVLSLYPMVAIAETVTFGIVPQHSASRLVKMWAPLLTEMSARSGITVQFRTAKDIPTFEACLAQGAFQVAYMNPMHYAIFAEANGYRAMGHQKGKKLKGILVARKDSGLQDLNALNGSDLAFPSPGAFGASVLNRAALRDMGVEFTPNYVKSHDSVYRAVVAGLFPAGGGVLRTFNALDPDLRDQLEIIYETEAYTPHAFAAHSDLSAASVTALRTALQSISEERPDLFEGVGMTGIQIAEDTAWDDVRALNMSRSDAGISDAEDGTCPSG